MKLSATTMNTLRDRTNKDPTKRPAKPSDPATATPAKHSDPATRPATATPATATPAKPSDLATTTPAKPSPEGGADESSPSTAAAMADLDQTAATAVGNAEALRRKMRQQKEDQKLLKQQRAALTIFADAAKAAEADAVADAIEAEQKEIKLQKMGDEISKLTKYKDLSKSLQESFENARNNVRRLRKERKGMIVAAADLYATETALRSSLAANDREITKLAKLATARQHNEEKLHKQVQSLKLTLKNLSRS